MDYLPHNWTSGVFYERPNLLFLAYPLSVDFLLNEQKMLAFSFCILEENDSDVVKCGCLVYLNHKNSVCWTFASGQSFRISNIRYFCQKCAFVSNHSTWGTEFSAAQVLPTATPVLRTIRSILETFVANLKIAVGVNPLVSNGEPRLNVPSLLEPGENMKFSPKIRHIPLPCENCDIKNGRKQVKKFGQPWLTLTVQFLYVFKLLLFLRACQAKELPVSLSLSFFIAPRWRLGQDRLRKMKKSSSVYSLRQSTIAEKMKRCVP